MGIFSSIKDAIFGTEPELARAQATRTVAAPAQAGARSTNAEASAAQPKPERASDDRIDVENSLDSMPGSDRLNWRTSIVDLMKLIGVDSDYESRKALAQELGRPEYSGSAEDNVWLHRRTMRELSQHGGRVPAEFLD